MGGNIFGIGLGELIFIAILALVIFGPKRIPDIARSVGKFMQELRQMTGGLDQEMRQWMNGIETPDSWLGDKPPAASPAPPKSPPLPAQRVPLKVPPQGAEAFPPASPKEPAQEGSAHDAAGQAPPAGRE